jgi:hypothetical protein
LGAVNPNRQKRERGSGVHGVMAASADTSAWSFGGSIPTFAFGDGE